MRAKQQGFTLVELMVSIAIAAVLAAMAAPSFSTFVSKGRADSASKQLFSDLNAARVEAIKRNRRVLVCPSPTTSTITTCASGNSWNNGWILCVDGDSDGTCDSITDATDPNYPNPFAVRSALSSAVTVTGTANPITFRPDGSGVVAVLTVVSGSTNKTVGVAPTGFVTQN
jgi:type IV fimbrial biogenesis protein FimT